MAQGGGDQFLRTDAQQFGALLAPLPAHQRELFDADVLEAVGAHIVGGPVGGGLFRARPRRAGAETSGDLGDVVEGDVGLQRLIAHLFGGADGPGVLRQNRRGDQAERQCAGGHQTGVERHGAPPRLTQRGGTLAGGTCDRKPQVPAKITRP
ncbi:hypothetical protein D3C80_1386300 [compost metagenome]